MHSLSIKIYLQTKPPLKIEIPRANSLIQMAAEIALTELKIVMMVTMIIMMPMMMVIIIIIIIMESKKRMGTNQ